MADDLSVDFTGELPAVPKQPELHTDNPLRPIAETWLKKIEAARKAKSVFDADAREATLFFDGHGSGSWFFTGSSPNRGPSLMSRPTPAPAFRMTMNRVFEAVKLLGAVIYNRNPVRTVTPRKYPVIPPQMVGVDPNAYQVDPMTGQPIPDPSVQQYIETSNAVGDADSRKGVIAELLSTYLNYTPVELDLKTHSRLVVDEGIIKGMGLWWTEATEFPNVPPAEPTLVVGSFADSVDNLFLDPDAQTIEEIQWCAKKCVLPVDQVARMFGLTREDLKGHLESYESTSRESDRGFRTQRRIGKTNDLCTFFKVWSKCGFGDRLKGTKKEDRGVFDPLGDYCYLVVAPGVDFPLNVPPAAMQEQPDQDGLPGNLRARASWPIPLWSMPNGWPFTPLAFHRKPNTLWPLSHIKPGVGELRFLNWAISFLATRIAVSCETLIGVSKSADQDIKDQILAPSENGFKIIEISESMGKSVNDIVSVFQQPGVTRDMWDIVAAVAEMFDKRVGLTELTYGISRQQMRSATEANVKGQAVSVRPDDMANALEDAMSVIARKEAIAARWLLQAKDVAPVLGPLGAQAWDMHLSSNTGVDVGVIGREFDYRIESGSARKPNKDTRIDQMQQAVQTLGPILSSLATGMGNVEPFNRLMSDWANSLDLDASGYMLPPPPPPPPMLPPNGPPPPEGDAPGGGGPPDAPPEDQPGQ
jgi:hypothetical protein